VVREDQGSYQCIARNSVGSIISEMIPLSVAYMTEFAPLAASTLRVRTGHAAVFQFPNISSEPGPSVTWQSDDNTLLYGTKYATTADSRLVILDVNPGDVKRYRARATNTQLGKEENSPWVALDVDTSHDTDVSPEVIVAPVDTVMKRLTPSTGLQCIANARPLYELELLWFKDGVPIEQAGVPHSFDDLWNRTLSLISADFVHDGTYTCQVPPSPFRPSFLLLQLPLTVRMRTGGPTLRREARVRVIGKILFPLNSSSSFPSSSSTSSPPPPPPPPPPLPPPPPPILLHLLLLSTLMGESWQTISFLHDGRPSVYTAPRNTLF
jgi:hypothetical protein